MPISGAATTSASTAAATPAVDSGDLVNLPAGDPATERWPGANDPGQYTDAGAAYPIEGPPYGSWFAEPFATVLPEGAPGGGIQDTSWMTGTDGPIAAWDSNAGAPFAPSGAPPAELHAEDTGAVFKALYAVPAAVGEITRTSVPGQTYNREYAFDPVTGENVPARNGRMNLDQRQVWDPAPGDGGGWAPWDPGYAERPIYNNVAYEATPVNNTASYLSVSGDLPDRAPVQDYVAASYEAPPDPIVNQPAAPAASAGGGWLLG